MKKIQSLERAMRIVELIDSLGGKEGLGGNEIAGIARLKIPTVHNFLQTFVALGYLERNEKKYRVSEKLRFLGWEGDRKSELLQNARRELYRLASDWDETVILAARAGRIWQTLIQYESGRRLVARTPFPPTENFYISATGRCILSVLPPEQLEEIVAGFRLPSPDEWPEAQTPDEMRRELERILRDGYELYRNDEFGVIGIGAVIRPFGNASFGALGMIVPACRFAGNRREKILTRIREAAGNIH